MPQPQHARTFRQGRDDLRHVILRGDCARSLSRLRLTTELRFSQTEL